MNDAPRARVAITGMGVKSPAGNDVKTFWQTILAGKSVASEITLFDHSTMSVHFGCEVPEFDLDAYITPKEQRRLDRVTQFAIAAALDASKDAGEIDTDPARCAVVIGCGVGGLSTLEEEILRYRTTGRVSPMLVPIMMSNAPAGNVAIQLGFTGPNFSVATACASAANAIGEGSRIIRYGEADVVMAGGAEAGLTPTGMAAFAKMGALSHRNEDPAAASRPFDEGRDGFVMGEGAAMLVLEEWGHAKARGANILGEVVGYGRNADAYHITAPSPDGTGASACMELALSDAGLSPSAIGHVNAHGTSTPLNDSGEAAAVIKVFGDNAPPVTSTKGVTGHLIGAAGAVEAIISVLSLRDNVIPPTANYVRSEEAIKVRVVHSVPEPSEDAYVISNSFGFGGHNGSLVFSKGD